MISILIGLSIGSGAVVARYVGAKDQENANLAALQGVILMSAAPVVLGVIGIIFARPLLTLVGADSATLLLVAATSYVNYHDVSGDPTARNNQTLKAIGNKSYAALKKYHVADYQALFRRCMLDLGVTDKAKRPTNQRLKPFGPGDTTSKKPGLCGQCFDAISTLPCIHKPESPVERARRLCQYSIPRHLKKDRNEAGEKGPRYLPLV